MDDFMSKFERDVNAEGHTLIKWKVPPLKGDRLVNDAGDEVFFQMLSKTGLLCCTRLIDGMKVKYDPSRFSIFN